MRRMLFTALALLVAVTCASAVQAGELSLFSKTGYMDWKEIENGRQFIRETGPTQELGVRLLTRPGFLEMHSTMAVWGAVFGYDGRSAETAQPRKMTTGNAGVRGEHLVAVPVRVSPGVEFAPLAAVGGGYFWRSVGPEHWLVLDAKAGARVKVRGFELLGGVRLPWKTRSVVDWTGIGASSKATLEPKGKMTPFLEANVRRGNWKVGLFYEPLRWEASPSVPFSYSGNNPAAALATATGIHQPATRVQHLGISVEYRF